MQQPINTSEIPKAKRIRVHDLKDLLKILISNKMTLNPNEVYCIKYNGHYVYFVKSVLTYYNIEGLPLVLYTETDLSPNEFLWYNLKTASVTGHKYPKPTDPDETDNTMVFSVINVEELPNFFEVWKEENSS